MYYKVDGNLSSMMGIDVVECSSEEFINSFEDSNLQKVGNCNIHIKDADYNGCKFIGKEVNSFDDIPNSIVSGMYLQGTNMFKNSKEYENFGATLDYLLEDDGIKVVLMYGMSYGELFVPFGDSIEDLLNVNTCSKVMCKGLEVHDISSYEVSSSDLLGVEGIKDFIVKGFKFFVSEKGKDTLDVKSIRFILNCGFNGTKIPNKYYEGYCPNYTLEDWADGSTEIVKGYRKVYLFTC